MKRAILFLIMAVISLNVICAVIDYTAINHQTLLHEHQGIGTHSVVWNGKDSNANPCSTGMYFYKLTFNGKSIFKKMLMLK